MQPTDQTLPTVPEKLLKPYDPAAEEPKQYQKWEQSGFFNPEHMIAAGLTAPDAEPYTIMLPPPNVTGVLHMGHALGGTVQDILIRYKRMQGFRALWLPGTDHAAIATQSKVEKEIQKSEGKNRYDLGREELLKRVEQFAQGSHDTMVTQIKALGFSCDWSREAFTLDEQRNLAVRTIFARMYKDGLIYRGHRIVNWDPKGQTTISDDEIVYESRKATMYTFKYSADFPLSVSTTRPETKVGDVAVAVHPDDARYAEYVGKEYDAVFCGVPIHITIIADEAVEKDFGTGALGVTPAHSAIDWDMAERHGLPHVQVINEYAKMTVGDERLMGKKVGDARETIVAWLKEQGLLEREEIIDQNVATAERTGGIIEPLPKLQWFVGVNTPFTTLSGKTTTLKALMTDAVASGATRIIPDHFEKTYFHWIENLRDWCISRQIWYGHRIPVWYREQEIFCGISAPDGEGWTQDEDTLDTWFSSGLWSFSTLGWPEQTEDLRIYHPTTTLVTAYEIIFFWVARMILMTGYALDTAPFTNVLMTGIVRDAQGRKISKSLGNGIDPLEIAAKYGADAGRMALIVGSAPGTDTKISEDKIKGYKHFANKLWNITRFVLGSVSDDIRAQDTATLRATIMAGTDIGTTIEASAKDRMLYDEWRAALQEITTDLDNHRLHIASERIYHYVWHTYADSIIEESKAVVATDASRQALLMLLLREMIAALHPFMPFVTETLWSMVQPTDSLLMTEHWPSR